MQAVPHNFNNMDLELVIDTVDESFGGKTCKLTELDIHSEQRCCYVHNRCYMFITPKNT